MKSVAVIATVCLTIPSIWAQTAQTGQLNIRVGSDGGELSNCRVHSFIDVTGKQNFTSKFEGLRGSGIPFGKYYYRIWCGPEWKAEPEIFGSVRVLLTEDSTVAYQPTFPVAGISIDTWCARRNGTAFGLSRSAEPTWIRFNRDGTAPLGDEQQVDPQGRFTLSGCLQGSYVANVIREGKIIYEQRFTFNLRSPDARVPMRYQKEMTPIVLDLRVVNPPTVEVD